MQKNKFLLTLTTSLIFVIAFNLVSASITATPNTIKLTNTTIDVGQFTIANTLISGGTGGPFSGEWVGFQGNFINSLYFQLPSTITVGSIPSSVAFNPSDTLAYVVNEGSDTVNVINPATNSVINTITVGSTPSSVAFNPSGTLAYVVNSGSRTVNVINPATNSIITTFGTNGVDPVSVAFNPSGTLAYVANENSGTVSVLNMLPETAIYSLPTISSSASLQSKIYALSSNTFSITFNGLTYSGNTGSNTIYGTWNIFGFAEDNGSNLYGYGSNTILLSNTLTINPTPTVSISLPSNSVYLGQSISITSNVIGGTAPYTYNVIISNATTNAIILTNSITTNSLSNVFSYTPNALGNVAANVLITDSATTPETVNSIPYHFNVLSQPQSNNGGGGSSSTTLSISDNLNVQSSASILTVTLLNPSTKAVISKTSYTQSELPATITLSNEEAELNFTCSFNVGSSTYKYSNDTYGLGC